MSELPLTSFLCLQLFDMERNTFHWGLPSILEDAECNFLKRRIEDSALPTATYGLQIMNNEKQIFAQAHKTQFMNEYKQTATPKLAQQTQTC